MSDVLDEAVERFMDAVEARLRAQDAEIAELRSAGALRGEPGPAGEPGAPGEQGAPGERGADGVVQPEEVQRAAAEALAAALESAVLEGRTLRIGTRELRLAVPLYRGVWVEGDAYERGDVVTRDGSAWHCNAEAPAGKPGDEGSGWQLMVKQGRDARR